MTAPAFVRAAVDHVRTPLYLNAYAMIASNLLNSVLGLVYWGLAARLYSIESLGISSAVISSMRGRSEALIVRPNAYPSIFFASVVMTCVSFPCRYSRSP